MIAKLGIMDFKLLTIFALISLSASVALAGKFYCFRSSGGYTERGNECVGKCYCFRSSGVYTERVNESVGKARVGFECGVSFLSKLLRVGNRVCELG